MHRKTSLGSEEPPLKTSAVTAADLARSVLAVPPLARRGDPEPDPIAAGVHP
jgi:hypothetical protein